MVSVVLGSGRYVPDRVVTNHELVAYVGGSAQWVEERTGIVTRRWAGSAETTSGMGCAAARVAMEEAGWGAGDVDALIFATLSPDVAFPGCGVLAQRELGLGFVPALDVRNQCSGYLYALSVADAWIRAGVYERVLIIGAEIHSAGLDVSEEGRAIAVLFGDGAGAVCLGRGEVGGVREVRLGSDGAGAEQLWCERPGARGGTHITREDLRDKRHFPSMNGRAVFRRAIETLERELRATFDAHGIDPADERLVLVPHQANRRINEHLARTLGVPDEHVVHTITEYGNTTAASIPMAFDVARRDGRIAPGSLVVHAAFGSGYTWGVGVVEV